MTKHKSMLDVIMMELMACTFASPSIMAIFWLFSLFTSHRSEADRRMVEIAKKVADERAKVVLSAVPQSRIVAASETMQPDQSEEAVLGIEGEELPASAEDPRTTAETMSAAILRADPDRPRGRKARNKKKPSRDSVRLWIKEGTVPREGRYVWSSDAYADYKRWCADRNLTPVSPQTFGCVLRDEIEHVVPERSNGRTKYHGIGLRHGMKVVSA